MDKIVVCGQEYVRVEEKRRPFCVNCDLADKCGKVANIFPPKFTCMGAEVWKLNK